MTIEIDQSGKIENTRVNTVIAFSDGIRKAILISAKDKRELQKVFRDAGKPLVFVYKTFALLVFLLIKDDLKNISQIIIDKEYPGWSFQIKDYLLQKIRKNRAFAKEDIHFTEIGKKSKAHSLAYRIYAGKEKSDKIIRVDDIIKLLL